MITEIQKSINSILYERVASPFFGALISSWLVWNWRIVYLTLFVSESKIKVNKIDYIIEHFFDFNILVIYPLISTVILLTIIPVISNAAYWLDIKFNKWKTDQKHKLEMTALLTNEQSIQLREEIEKSKVQIEKLLEGKDFEIKQLNLQLVELNNKDSLETKEPHIAEKIEIKTSSNIGDIVKKISSNLELSQSFQEVVDRIQGGYVVKGREVSSTALAFFEANYLIKNASGGRYSLTDIGRDVLKELMDKKY